MLIGKLTKSGLIVFKGTNQLNQTAAGVIQRCQDSVVLPYTTQLEDPAPVLRGKSCHQQVPPIWPP